MQTKPASLIKDTLKNVSTDAENASAYASENNYTNAELDLEIKRQHLITLQNNNAARIRYAKRIFILTCIWITVIIVIVALAGLNLIHLSDAVLITLIGTSTANFFGFFIIVVKYLFNIQTLPELNNHYR